MCKIEYFVKTYQIMGYGSITDNKFKAILTKKSKEGFQIKTITTIYLDAHLNSIIQLVMVKEISNG